MHTQKITFKCKQLCMKPTLGKGWKSIQGLSAQCAHIKKKDVSQVRHIFFCRLSVSLIEAKTWTLDIFLFWITKAIKSWYLIQMQGFTSTNSRQKQFGFETCLVLKNKLSNHWIFLAYIIQCVNKFVVDWLFKLSHTRIPVGSEGWSQHRATVCVLEKKAAMGQRPQNVV